MEIAVRKDGSLERICQRHGTHIKVKVEKDYLVAPCPYCLEEIFRKGYVRLKEEK